MLPIGILERPSRGLCVRGWEMELEGGDPGGPPHAPPPPARPAPAPAAALQRGGSYDFLPVNHVPSSCLTSVLLVFLCLDPCTSLPLWGDRRADTGARWRGLGAGCGQGHGWMSFAVQEGGRWPRTEMGKGPTRSGDG